MFRPNGPSSGESQPLFTIFSRRHRTSTDPLFLVLLLFIDTSLSYFTTCFSPTGHLQVIAGVFNRLVVIYLYIHTQQDATHRDKVTGYQLHFIILKHDERRR
jgi:hypothetical protein